jgi:hypothetical protein
MQRADLTTRRRSRPSPRVASTSRRPRVGSCDHDRRGRRVHARRLARGSRRWAIRWAKPGRIGPYRAHHHSPATLPDIAYFQVLSGSTRHERHASHARGRRFETRRAHPRNSLQLRARASADSGPGQPPDPPLGHSLGQTWGSDAAARSSGTRRAGLWPNGRAAASRTSNAWATLPTPRSSSAIRTASLGRAAQARRGTPMRPRRGAVSLRGNSAGRGDRDARGNRHASPGAGRRSRRKLSATRAAEA